VEETLFRGLLQTWIGWIPASILFGLGHLGGGWKLALLSLIAGLLYGRSYLKGRIESAILLHFSVNLLHFLLFTYPWLGVKH
jgi:membrane protease YdiL (CAAX protease family)